MFIEMNVYGFALDALTKKLAVLLRDLREENMVPIWVSSNEAVSIAVELIGREMISHSGREDLVAVLLKQLGVSVTRISIERICDGILYGTLTSRREGSDDVTVEIKGSEAVLCSLKYRLPILVDYTVLTQASLDSLGNGGAESDARRFVEFLDNLDPKDMGKYPM
ncbi:bifunctional nuclease domain-containing protein [Geobacter sp. DSM 9736]|uniref:bifunctional nuclease domain-containing protein n=1 Tax=Geobacter sp. DSM 9736 TaxID=1277350 RepID=UPI000B4FFB24|nr:bifunctional nuclease domain-containing protein [Geobacter sp. DSM 9736]SNB45744.1 hypothetical protein SAMN06269301_1172 [Geobacter sp. DSM 9736]